MPNQEAVICRETRVIPRTRHRSAQSCFLTPLPGGSGAVRGSDRPRGQIETKSFDGTAKYEMSSKLTASSNLGEPLPFLPGGASWTRRELLWRNRQLTALNRISEIMLFQGSEETRFDLIAAEISLMSGFPMAAIELCDFERQVMIYRGAHGMDFAELPLPFEMPMDVSLSGQVAHTGDALIETHAESRREWAAPIIRRFGFQSFVCVPIKTNGIVIGTLSLGHPESVTIEPKLVAALSNLANFLATLFDRLHARDSAQRSEAELVAVYDRAPNVMCLFDERLRIIRANHAAAVFSGHTPKELTGMRASQFFQCSVGRHDCLEAGSATACSNCDLRRVVSETLATGKIWHQVRVKRTRAGGTVAEDSTLMVSTERLQVGGVQRVLLCIEDISQSVRADEQLRSQAALLEITRDAIFVRDFCDRVLYWNEGAHRLYGWTVAEARGKTTAQLALDAKPADSAHALKAVQEKGEWSGELRHRTRDGRDVVVQSRWTLVGEVGQSSSAILVVNTDITERKALESQLLRVQRLESIGTLASGLAHDLNNVLAPIMMAVNILREDAENEDAKRWLQTLETCSQRAAGIVRQVLTFARGIEGARVLVNPAHLIKDMARIARETFPRSIEVEMEVNGNSHVVMGDATQLHQVLMNLCLNARDAMPTGGTLSLRLSAAELAAETARIHPKAQPGSYLVISVRDTGSGIPPELLDKIFDPFFTTKPIGQGTGLGLPSVLGIAESHGGFVQVETAPGQGSTFNVYLPRARELGEVTPVGRNEGACPRGNGETILVVDDEPAVRKIASAVLTANGYRVVSAAEGAEAVSVFHEYRTQIKVVVSDLMMPRMDGPTALRVLRKLQPELKSIIITGLGEEGRIAEARAAGADLVLHKPFASEKLLNALHELLHRAPVTN